MAVRESAKQRVLEAIKTLSYQRSQSFDVVRFATAAAAIAVTRHGALPSMPTRAEVEAFLSAQAEVAL